MKIQVHNHASVVLAYNGKRILTNVYDSTYPKEIWRNRINFLGGGQSKTDSSPIQLLLRELGEEFNIPQEQSSEPEIYDKSFSDVVGEGKGAPKISRFASQEDIALVKNALLKNLKPYKDFLITIPAYKDRPETNIIFSCFISEISEEAMDCASRNLQEGKSLVSEGFLKLTNLEEVVEGKVLTAWATGIILSDFFNIYVPNPENVGYKILGAPRESLQDYFTEYDYALK